MKSVLFSSLFVLAGILHPHLAHALELNVEHAVQVSFNAEEGRDYLIERTSAALPAEWGSVSGVIAGDGSIHSEPYVTTNRAMFYRVREVEAGSGATGPHSPVDVILDCDPGNDQDDIGDLSVLHALADSGELRILAIMSSLRQPWSAPGIEVMNRFYGRPEINIGVPSENVYSALDHYGSFLANNFEHAVGDSSNAYNAVALYRKVLASRAQNSVTLIFGGQLKNLADLWNSSPDNYSPLSGSALLTNKCNKIIVVAGIYPNSGGGAEYNFATDPAHGAILNSITTNIRVSYVGIEQGNTVEIGGTIVQKKPALNPAREAFRLGAEAGFQNPRPAWTGLALLHAARGYTWRGTALFTAVKGSNFVDPATGENIFSADPSANQEYLIKAQPDTFYESILDAMLMRNPLSQQSGATQLANGTASSPSLIWDESDTGFYRPASGFSGEVDFVGDGVDVLRLFSGGLAFRQSAGIYWASGELGTGVDVGLQRDGPNTLRVVSTGSTLGKIKASDLLVGSGSVKISSGAGSPEGVLPGPVGSLYLRSDGGQGTTLYVKEVGTGATGWAAK